MNQLTFIGHTALEINLDGKIILIDPNYSQRVLWFWKRKAKLSNLISAATKVSAVIITDPARPQLDIFSFKFFSLKIPVITPPGVDKIIEPFLHYPLLPLKPYSTHQLDTISIKAYPSKHFGFRAGSCRLYHSNAYIIKSAQKTIYVNSGSAPSAHFAEVAKQEKIDIACLPIGGYTPRWFFKNHNMDPTGTLQAFQDLGAKILVPIRWGTFRRSLEPMSEPLRLLTQTASAQGLADTIKILKPGEGLNF